MNYIGTAITDIGNVKKSNQDSMCLKIAHTKERGQIVMAMVCDGMGGLQKGELASATLVREFSHWFEQTLPERLVELCWKSLSEEWVMMVKNLNHKILNYGKNNHLTLGTTITAILIIEEKFMIIHVGDTRVYKLSNGIKQLTEDQTYIAREIKLGNITVEQASVDSRKNILLQCVGASKSVEPEIIYGTIEPGEVILLCSDGFRHVVTEEEIYRQFYPIHMKDEKDMQEKGKQMIEMIKQRQERDNISMLLIKSME